MSRWLEEKLAVLRSYRLKEADVIDFPNSGKKASYRVIKDLKVALRQALGNKGYMRDIDNILDNMRLSGKEENDLYYLVRDLKNL